MKRSAGLLMYRLHRGVPEFFLVHPGGPYFVQRDVGAWSLPKGEIESGEQPLEVACREFAEETGQTVECCAAAQTPRFSPLGTVKQKGGKIVEAWAFPGDWPAGATLVSNTFPLEWPPRSGEFVETPEVDRGEFFAEAAAREKINPAQAGFLDRLLEQIGED